MMALLQWTLERAAPFVVMISLIVTIHELGHFLTAKAFGVAIDCFSIGFGPTLASWRDRSGVEWRIGALPLGGYVKFSGDENVASVSDETHLVTLRRAIVMREGVGAEKRYLPFKPLWQRSLIILAGPGANFLLAVVLFAAMFMAFGRPLTSSRVSFVEPASAASRDGFQVGDIVEKADSKAIHGFDDLLFYVQYRAGVPIDFTVLRAGRPLHLTATPQARQSDSVFGGKQSVGHLGLGGTAAGQAPVNPGQALALGVQKTWDVTATTLFYLGRIVTGKVGADQLHSIVGMAVASGAITHQAVEVAKVAHVSWIVTVGDAMLQMAALMSVSVGILNLLPIPVLDGGHLLAFGYEAVARRPPAAAVQAVGYRAGLALLVGLMLFATWNDLGRQQVFHIFGSLFS
jgi:regulator of sigma E protease